MLKNAKGEIPDAHRVVDDVIEIGTNVKARGAISGAECTILGLAR